MPRLVYNGLTLPFQNTSGYRQVPVLENGHYVRTDHDITVKSVLTPHTICLPGESFTAALARVKHLLERPRQSLYVFFDSPIPYINAPGADAHDGPTPTLIDLHQFAGLDSAHLTLNVKVATRDCPNTGDPGPAWTYHAWKESIDIDDEHATTVTRTGLLRLRGDRLDRFERSGKGWVLNASADAFRGFVSPGVPDWFVRTRSHYDVQEDGLALRYTFTDTEQYAMPPAPAVKAAGRYTLSSSNGAKMYAQVNYTLTGRMDAGDHRDAQRPGGFPPSTGKQRLLETCIAVAMNRLKRGNSPPGSKGRWLITGEVSSDEYKPSVSVTLRTIVVPPKTTQQVQGVAMTPVGAAFGGLGAGRATGIIAAVEEAARRARAAGGKGENDELPRGLARLGWDIPPLHYDSPAVEVGRGSAPLLKLVAKAMQDPCLELSVFGGELRQREPFRPPVFSPVPVAGSPNSGTETPTESDSPGRQSADQLQAVAWAILASIGFVGVLADPLAEEDSSADGRVWTSVELRPRYHKGMGRIPRTEQRLGGLTRVIQVSAPSVRHVVEWSAERVGAPPEVPPEEHPDPNFTLLDSHWVPGVVDIGADGVTPIFTASGRYEYAVVDPSKLEAGAVFTPAAAEVYGRGTAPVLAGGPVLIDPTSTAVLTTGDQERWEQELQKWAGRP